MIDVKPCSRFESSSRQTAESDIEISVVIPVFNCATTADELCSRLQNALRKLGFPYEVIFVDDGSRDASGEILSREACEHPEFRLVRLVRNFGQHQAITAGMTLARGNWIVLMDDDLQNPPEEIAKLYEKAREGYDDVHGVREKRHDSAFRRIASRMAQKLMQAVIGRIDTDSSSAFRILSRRLVDEYLQLREHHSYVAVLVAWMGFPHASVVVDHAPRRAGRSGYSMTKLMCIWLNIAFGFSERLLTIATWCGIIFSILAFVLMGRSIFLYFMAKEPMLGYTSLFASQMFFFGIVMVFLGVLGEYVGRIYVEVKDRPCYIIDRKRSVPPVPIANKEDEHA